MNQGMRLVDGTSVGLGRVIDHLKDDAVRNLFAIYDLSKEPSNTSMLLAVEENEVKGYRLTYRGLSYPTAIIRGSGQATDLLLDNVVG